MQFNLRHPNELISPQATQKWLSGAARPTPDKINTLADWLNVSAQWLHFGIAERSKPSTTRPVSKKAATNRDAVSDDEIKLILHIRTLSAHRRFLVTEIVEEFALEQEMWQE